MQTIREIEADNLEAIESEIGSNIDTAWSFLEFTARVLSEIKTIDHPCPDQTKCVLIGILVEGMTLYRSIIELCRIGQASSAEIISRTLFELYLAERFILEPPPDGKFGLPRIPPSEDRTDFMAKVYFHASTLRIEKAATIISKNPKCAGILSPSFEQTARAAADEARKEKEIGVEWAERIVEKTTFAGLNVESVAAHYGLQPYYDTFYRCGSLIVHASDALTGMTPEEREGTKLITFAFHSKPAEVTTVLGLGNRWIVKLFAAATGFLVVNSLEDVMQLQMMEARLDGEIK